MPNPKKKNTPTGAYTDTGSNDNGKKLKNVRSATPAAQKKATQLQKSAVQGAMTGGAAGTTRKSAPRPLSRPTTQTKGTGVQQRRPYEKDFNIWAAADADGSAGQIGGKVLDEDFANGGTGKFYSLLASDGAGGRVTPPRTRDPFLDGFNSDIDGIRERPTGRKRRK